jgi:hypothetical protein
MKTKTLLLSSLIAIPALALLTSSTIDTDGKAKKEIALPKMALRTLNMVDTNGKLGNTGTPGEFTCSQATCHGAGNGSSTTGGLPDNGGPGSITLTSIPAFVGGNQYVPNTTYSITITVSQHGIGHFGFGFEALNNSGSTNTSINNAVGTITITDPIHTREGQPFGTGRNCATHQTNGGAFTNAANFNFNWTAPTAGTGTVNLYYDGIAADGDKLPDSQDNVYAHTLQLTPTGATFISTVNNHNSLVEIFPNPTTDVFTIRFNMNDANDVDAQLYSVDGKSLKTLANKKVAAGMFTESFSTEGLTTGFYFIRINMGGHTETHQIFVN